MSEAGYKGLKPYLFPNLTKSLDVYWGFFVAVVYFVLKLSNQNKEDTVLYKKNYPVIFYMPQIQLALLQFCWKQLIENTWFVKGFLSQQNLLLSWARNHHFELFLCLMSVGRMFCYLRMICPSKPFLETGRWEEVGRRGKPGRKISFRADDI